MRWLVAPLELKGSLSAVEAARAIARGLEARCPSDAIDLLPLADGGPGTLEAMVVALGGERVSAPCRDPLGRPVSGHWAALPGGVALIEMAQASGLWRLRRDERNACVTSTDGTGDLIGSALDAGFRSLLITAGGSATNDGGTGALRALGARFLDQSGNDLPPGGAELLRLSRIDLTALDSRLRQVSIRAATDVTSPLLGSTGASRMFAPQKGASAEDVELLERALTRLADVAAQQLGSDARERAGAGAAGGLGFGLAAFAGASLERGFDVVSEATRLRARVQQSDVVVTSEGRFDAQSALGKGPSEIRRLAQALGKKTVLLAGVIHGEQHGFDVAISISPERALPAAEAAARLEDIARRLKL